MREYRAPRRYLAAEALAAVPRLVVTWIGTLAFAARLPDRFDPYLVGAAVVITGFAVWEPCVEVFFRRLEVTETHLVRRVRGWFPSEKTVAQARVTAVAVETPWNLRVLRLQRIVIDVAGDDESRITVAALDTRQATALAATIEHARGEPPVATTAPLERVLYRITARDAVATVLLRGTLVAAAVGAVAVSADWEERLGIEVPPVVRIIAIVLVAIGGGLAGSLSQFWAFTVTEAPSGAVSITRGALSRSLHTFMPSEVSGVGVRQSPVDAIVGRVRIEFETASYSDEASAVVFPALRIDDAASLAAEVGARLPRKDSLRGARWTLIPAGILLISASPFLLTFWPVWGRILAMLMILVGASSFASRVTARARIDHDAQVLVWSTVGLSRRVRSFRLDTVRGVVSRRRPLDLCSEVVFGHSHEEYSLHRFGPRRDSVLAPGPGNMAPVVARGARQRGARRASLRVPTVGT